MFMRHQRLALTTTLAVLLLIPFALSAPPGPKPGEREGRPQDLFNRYLKDVGQPNDQVEALFSKLLDEALEPEDAS